MKIRLILMILGLWSLQAIAQPTGYYNGTGGKTGDELKTALNGIIDDHRQYSYFASKTIMKFSDADPTNPNNVILVYTGRSQANNDYGTGGDQINREHVWAKSHGNFNEVPPMFNDVHNLKPADASVNTLRSNKDFDNGGNEVTEAPGCFTTSDTWEPRDAVKGDIARIIFYMATRYEGNNGERDLKVVDYVNTYPAPEMGKLSTLLAWNQLDPPDDFERNRNNVIFQWQENRNPFIDHPEFVDMIWGTASAPDIYADNVHQSPKNPREEETVTISANMHGPTAFTSVKLYWGTSYDNLSNEVEMTSGKGVYTANIGGQAGQTNIFYKIVATDGNNTGESIIYNYYVAPIFNGTITTIYDIQGQQEESPYAGETVSTTGVVTGAFGNNYFLQDGTGAWNGLFIYDANHGPQIGDSIIVTGVIEEYYGKTELKDISAYYHISSNNALPEPAEINTGDGGEEWESVLVRVNNAVCTDAEYQSNYYMWQVNDGSGDLAVHNTSIFEYEPVKGDSYKVTGPLNFDFDEWKIELRLETDVQPASDIVAPEVISVEATNDSTLKVSFNEALSAATAELAANYTIDQGVEVKEANMHAIQTNLVYLKISNLSNGDYNITIKGVTDLAGNEMEETEMTFSWQGSAIDEILSNGSLEMYPNPATSQMKLKFETIMNTNVTVFIYNNKGQKVYSAEEMLQAGDQVLSIDLDRFSNGLYMMQFNTESGSISKKLIIQK